MGFVKDIQQSTDAHIANTVKLVDEPVHVTGVKEINTKITGDKCDKRKIPGGMPRDTRFVAEETFA